MLTTMQPLQVTPAVGDAFLDLMARTAHDLNNHLATILGKAEIAMMVDDPARWKRGVEEGYRAGQKARVLVSDFQRLHGWYTRESPDPVPIPDVLALVARIVDRVATRASVVLELGAAPARCVVEAAELALGTWSLVADAIERGGAHVGHSWTLSGSGDRVQGSCVLELHHPGVIWDAAAAAYAASPSGEAPSPRLGRAVALLRTLHATIELDGEHGRIVLTA